MLGLHRQFVFARSLALVCQNWLLLMANILTYLVIVLPRCQLASGIDTQNIWPSARVLSGEFFLKMPCLDPNFAKDVGYDPFA